MDKIKILFLAANPADTNSLKLDEEIRAITEKIRASDYRDSLDLVSAWAVRPDDLLQLLNQHKPHIVHFSGHGNQIGEIVLVDNAGYAKPVTPKAIKALFSSLKDNVRVVFFNACYSQSQAQAIGEIIDYVVGMNTTIGDRAAIIFAASFYRALGFGRSVQEAFEQGKTALLLESILEDRTPELLIRDGIDPNTPASLFSIEKADSGPKLLSKETRLIQTIREHKGWVYSVDWSPNGKFMAVGSSNVVELWQVADEWKLLHILEGHSSYVYDVAWSPDGQLIASASDDENVCVWRADNGQLLHALPEGEGHAVYKVAWHPYGYQLVSVSQTKVQFWQVSDGQLVSTHRKQVKIKSINGSTAKLAR